MNYPEYAGETIFIASDLTAGIFLIILIISIAFRSERRSGISHLLASAIMELAGIFLRLFAGTVEKIPADFSWEHETTFLTPVEAPVIWILSFLFIIIGIAESATYVIYINGGRKKSNLRIRAVVTGGIFTAGAISYIYFGSINCFTIVVVVQLIFCYLHIYKCCSEPVMCQFGRASLAALILFVSALFIDNARMTGIGLSMMLIILNEQYHHIVEHELMESEEELAKNKVQLLAEQISPHYIYNSLQSIRNLCDTDPARAIDAIDSFSEFLRGNLESLTVEGLIPFERELELTKAYLELEKLTGRGRFEVGYQLETTDFMLPPLVLQPVVENAVKHGAMRAAGMGQAGAGITEITISTRKSGGYICIEVTDRTVDGGYSAAADAALAGAEMRSKAQVNTGNRSKRKSVGLENVRTRLAIQSGGTLDLESTSDGTRVTIMLQFVSNSYTL